MRGGSSAARARRTAIVALLVAWNLLLTVAVIAEVLIGSRGATLLLSGPLLPSAPVTSRLQWWTWGSESEQAVPDSVAVRGFGASQGSCDPVKVTCPELRIESGILRT